MFKEGKHIAYLVLGYGLFQLLCATFFGADMFVSDQLNKTLYFSMLFMISIFSEFAIVILALKGFKNYEYKLLAFALSFSISALITGCLLYTFFAQMNGNLWIYIISFIIVSLPPSIWLLVRIIFDNADVKITEMVKATVHPSEKFEGVQEKVFHLENENGKLLLEVPVRRIICYEANDNYVITYYLNEEEQLKKSMERISLKKIEEILHSEGVEFARVHKSYLINVDYLSDIKGRSQAYRIQLRFFEELIPVSRAFDISTLPRVK
jgi:hypothetical protein